MCVTILGVTICISKAEAPSTSLRRYDPEQLLEEARHKALLYQMMNPQR